MKAIRWGETVASVALAAALGGGALAGEGGSELQAGADIEVKDAAVSPPTACSICAGGCSPADLRSTGGWARLATATNNQATVTVNQFFGGSGRDFDWSNPVNTASSGVNGGPVRLYRNLDDPANWGYYHYKGGCTNAGGYKASPVEWEDVLSSFVEGTPILMADGTYKAVEELKRGDAVMSYDARARQFVPGGVIGAVHAAGTRWVITSEGALAPAHLPFADGEWRGSAELRPGDTLVGEDGENTVVISVRTVEEPAPLYVLLAEDPHEFFAGHLLAHNAGPRTDLKDHGFARGTKIALADGRLIPIEQVKPGDKLIGYDDARRRYAVATVRGSARRMARRIRVVNGTLRLGLAQSLYLAKNARPASR